MRLREAAGLLRLLQGYIVACAAPSLPALATAACCPALRGLERALMTCGPLHSWPQDAIALQHALLAFLTTLMQRARVSLELAYHNLYFYYLLQEICGLYNVAGSCICKDSYGGQLLDAMVVVSCTLTCHFA